MLEHSAPGDRVPRGFQLEQEKIAWAKRLELTGAGRLPEVNLLGCEPGEIVEPGLVRDSNKDLDHAISFARGSGLGKVIATYR